MTTTMREPFSQEAQNLAYQSGIRQLAPLVDRIRALEALVAGLTARLESLEQAQNKSVPPHLREREVR
jgi:hypothetical protein